MSRAADTLISSVTADPLCRHIHCGEPYQYTIGLYEKAMPDMLSWREKLVAAGSAGYDFVEISIDETSTRLSRLDMSLEERQELVKTMEETGVPIRSMCLSGHRKYPLGSTDKAARERSLEIMKKAVQLADDLGIRIIMLAGYDVYYETSTEETRKYFLEGLKESTTMAAKQGILLAFETMETPFMNTVEKAMYYVKEVGSPYLNVYPDLGNINNAALDAGKNVLDDMDSGEGRIVSLHLKETVPGVYRNMMYGEGEVPFSALIKKAWEMGVRRYVTEFWYQGGEDWKQELAFANQAMRKYLDEQE